jgi:isocitrate dehydrogenase (NAD+)
VLLVVLPVVVRIEGEHSMRRAAPHDITRSVAEESSRRAHRIVLLPGDGIGPDVTAAARRAVDAAGVPVEWEVHEVGLPALEKVGEPLPRAVLEAIRQARVALKGPVSTPADGRFRSVNLALRAELGLFAQVRPCRSLPGVATSFAPVDLVLIRQTDEDLYAGIEFNSGTAETTELVEWLAARGRHVHPEAGLSIKPISELAARRIFEFAFAYARANDRRMVTAVHKATVMPATDGLFLSAARDVAAENSDIEFRDDLVDNLAARLIRRPAEHDIIVAPNLYADILSDVAAALVGGVGVAPGANVGPHAAIFEPAHGSAPRHAGSNRANPIAAILSAALMLRHLGDRPAAARIEEAVAAVVRERRRLTYDLRSSADAAPAAGTAEVAEAVVRKLASQRHVEWDVDG